MTSESPDNPTGSATPTPSPRLPEAAIVKRDHPLPPAPPGVRYVDVVFLGRVISTDRLRDRIERVFHWPMLVLALLILPLVGIELLFQPLSPWLWWPWMIGMTIIWIAFFIEFIVKIAIAESRVEYAKHNWLDIVIILVPILRPLRVASVARTSRVFTLRGAGIRVLRYLVTIVIGLEATEKLLARIGFARRDERPAPETMTRAELMREVRRLRRHADDWAAWHDAHEAWLAEHADAAASFDEPAPAADDPASLPPPADRDPAAGSSPSCESPSPS